ncbi:protein O-mannose kinase-like [Branchiostoma floridae x Branchiostoma japonicum]
MRLFRVRSVARLLLGLLLLFSLRSLWAWFDSHADLPPRDPRENEMWDRRRQGKVEEPRPDVAKGAEVELEKRVNMSDLCPPGSFRLARMEACLPWLRCGEIAAEVAVRELCDWGGIKKVYRATWRGHTVAYLNLTRKHFPWRDFFLNHVTMLQRLQSGHVVQLVGWCNTTLVTEYHRFGSADRIEAVLSSGEFSRFASSPLSGGVTYIRYIRYGGVV